MERKGTNKKQARQGDVFLEASKLARAKLLSMGGKVVPRDKGRVVLAYGEVTGHAHAIADECELIELPDGRAFVVSDAGIALKHEEHDFIEFGKGSREVVIQTEYSPAELRNVTD